MKIMQMALLKHAAHHRERQAQEQYRDEKRGATSREMSVSAQMHSDLADEYERLAAMYEQIEAETEREKLKPIRLMLDGVELPPRSWQECGPDWVDVFVYDIGGNAMWHENGMPVIERRTGKLEIIGREVDPDALGGVAS